MEGYDTETRVGSVSIKLQKTEIERVKKAREAQKNA